MTKRVKGRVLLVEDDRDSRIALSMLCELDGFEVLSAVDGREALYLAMTEEVDIVVTDISMPRVSGLELIETIRREPALAGLPIIAMSAVNRRHLERATELGAVAVYQKPFEYAEFSSKVSEVMRGLAGGRRSETVPPDPGPSGPSD